jgi:hypothetical protein
LVKTFNANKAGNAARAKNAPNISSRLSQAEDVGILLQHAVDHIDLLESVAESPPVSLIGEALRLF